MVEFPMKNRDKLITGRTVTQMHEALGPSRQFAAVAKEWKRLTDAEYASREGWNIRLDTAGRISAYVTPFQSMTGDIPQALAEELFKLNGKHPTELVVQRTSRKALVLAVKGDIWRVHPDVIESVDNAVRAYNSVRAPLRPLNDVQRLGHLDEEDAIKCLFPPCAGFIAHKTYPIESETINGRKVEKRQHWRKKDREEEVLVTGQELLLRICDEKGEWHVFTQYPLGEEQEKERPEKHFHTLAELVEGFEIPTVQTVEDLHAEQVAIYRERLKALESAA